MLLLIFPLALLLQSPDPASRIALADARLAALDDEGARAAAAPLVDDPTVPAALRSQAALRVVQAESNLLHEDKAVAACKAALASNPQATLPPDATPAAVAACAAAQAQLAAAAAAPAALPAKPGAETEPAIGWVRPTSYPIMAVGAVMLVAGGALAVGWGLARWGLEKTSDTQQLDVLNRALFPLAVGAIAAILLSIPVAGTGIALFFLGGDDGPLRDKRPNHE